MHNSLLSRPVRYGLYGIVLTVLLSFGTANGRSLLPPQQRETTDLQEKAQELYARARGLHAEQQFEQANFYFTKAQNLFGQLENWTLLVNCAIYRSQIQYDQKHLDSLQLITQAAQLILDREELPKEYYQQERISFFQALYLERTAQYQEAASTLEQATAILKELDKFDALDSTYLSSHQSLSGSIYYERRDYETAVNHYQAALDWFPVSRPDEEKQLTINNNMGLAFIEMRQVQEGMKYLKRSLAILPKLNREQSYEGYLQTYFNLIRGYLLQKDKVSAKHYLDLANDLLKNHSEDRHIWHSLLAQWQEQQGQYDEALDHYQTAVIQRKVRRGDRHPSLAKLYLSMGQITLAQNREEEALQYFQHGLRVFTPGLDSNQAFAVPELRAVNDYYLLIQLLNYRGACLKKLFPDEGQQILPTYRVAIQAIDSLRLLYESDASKLLLSKEAKSVFASALELIYPLYQASADPALLEEAFRYMEKSKSLLLLENIRKWRNIRLQSFGGDPGDDDFSEWMEREKNTKLDLILLRREMEDLQKEDTQQTTGKRLNLERELQKVSTRYQRIKSVLSERFPQYYQASYGEEVAGLKEIRKQLLRNRQTQLISYFIFNDQSYAMLVSRDTVILSKLAPQADWVSDFEDYQNALRARGDALVRSEVYQSYTSSAKRLYDKLLRKLLTETPLKNRRLYLVPDDILGFLAFESLLSAAPNPGVISYAPDQLDYLIEDAALSYGYSATLLLESTKKIKGPDQRKDYGGFAPVFRDGGVGRAVSRDCTAGNLMYLPYSEQSVQKTSKFLDGRAFLNEEASLENFKKAAKNYRILQLATHACIDDRDALFNVIYFHDTTLATYEIFDISTRADLVILSACETGHGDLLEGEGIMSLSRGFYYAGSANIVTSLWPADDYATQNLMVRFNEYLKEGRPKDEALQKAKLDYLNTPGLREMSAAPAFWATFILIGNQEKISLDAQRISIWQWLLLPFLGLSLFVSIFYVLNRRY